MGEIFLAEDTVLARPVALKVLSDRYAEDPALRRRFLREANAAAQLSGHPHVVTIYDVGESQGRPFIAMEYLPNGDLRGRLAEGRPPFETTARWAQQAASALDLAHERGIVHRDVKPANLLLDARCDLRVADFGIARVIDPVTTAMTLPGTVLGTAGYISPEQARGEHATAASDVYSLAAVVFELTTGRRPFQRANDTDEVAAHVSDPVPRASAAAAGVPSELDAVFERALAKEPGRRYPTASAFASAYREALARANRPAVVMAPPRAATPQRPTMATYGDDHGGGGNRWLIAACLAVVALAGGAAIALGLTSGDPSSAGQIRTVVRQRTVERVVTNQGTTVTVPTTELRTVTVSDQASPTTAEASAVDGHTLNDQGYASMRSGDYASALAPLEQAVVSLRGRGPSDPYEAYANYNLGYTLLQLGRCGDAIAPLERARSLESSPAVPRALARARACAAAS